MNAAIIVAAGSSRRMGSDKLFAELCGESVLSHSLRAFQNCPHIDQIVIVTRAEKIDTVKSWGVEFHKLRHVIEGGQERRNSVWRGLEILTPEVRHVAVHDGARPLITPELIAQCLDAVERDRAVCCAAPVVDTLKRSEDLWLTESVNREGLWAMQTPQVFELALLKSAYRVALERGIAITDETSAVELAKGRVRLLRNAQVNFKVTFPQDLELARLVLEARRGGTCLL